MLWLKVSNSCFYFTQHPNEWVPEFAKRNLVQWYEESFSRTRLQGRFPYDNIYAAGYGLYDGSFAANTLDGEVNGGQDVGWYFWPRVVESLHDDFPDFAPMGGEGKPQDPSSCIRGFLL